MFAQTPEPPCCAVLCTSQRTADDGGYAYTAKRMLTLAKQQPGLWKTICVRMTFKP